MNENNVSKTTQKRLQMRDLENVNQSGIEETAHD